MPQLAQQIGRQIAEALPNIKKYHTWKQQLTNSGTFLILLQTLQKMEDAHILAITALGVMVVVENTISTGVSTLIDSSFSVLLPLSGKLGEELLEEIALKLYAYNGSLEGVKLAIECGVDIECRNLNSFERQEAIPTTASMVGAASGGILGSSIALGGGAAMTLLGLTSPLLGGVAFGSIVSSFFAKKFLANIPVWTQDDCGYDNHTPLILAARQGHLEVVKYLVAHGADLTRSTSQGKTALYWAEHPQQPAKFNQSVVDYLKSQALSSNSLIQGNPVQFVKVKRGGLANVTNLPKSTLSMKEGQMEGRIHGKAPSINFKFSNQVDDTMKEEIKDSEVSVDKATNALLFPPPRGIDIHSHISSSKESNSFPSFNQNVIWEKTDDPEYPMISIVDGKTYKIRINDWPDNPMYSLMEDDKVICDFEDWPESYCKMPSFSFP